MIVSFVWLAIQLVSVVSATMTVSTCPVARYKQSKSQNGDVFCATSPTPTDTVNINSKTECSHECAHSGATCAAGFNYKHRDKQCELFANPPTTLQVQQDCEYYAVCSYHFCVVYLQ